ncbi:MAG: NAD(P)/FAD-dependent oxidoreductase [Kiritimatiellia bacterium]|nr:NAD(P)/FAD-dependent oxidoreductase [Kiritimatiellia bacterium]
MNKRDKALGLDRTITRRDFVGATLVGSGAALLYPGIARTAGAPAFDPWTGYGGVGDYATSNGNTAGVRDDAHVIRDGLAGDLFDEAVDTGEMLDAVIVGGGFSGLGAAFAFQRHAPGKSCLVLDNHAMFGGEARENEFNVGGYRLWGPQGSNGFMPPAGNTTLSDEVWREVGMPMEYEFLDETAPIDGIRTAWDSYDAMFWGERHVDTGHFFGNAGWVKNIWDDDLKRTPWDSRMREDMLRAFSGNERFHEGDGLEAWLDSMSYKDYLEKVMGLDPRVTAYLDPILAISDYGLCSDVVSAYGAYLIMLPGMRGYTTADTFDFEQIKIMSFPGGNTSYARRIAQHLVPGCIGTDDSFEQTAHGAVNFAALDADEQTTRIRLSATAFDVRHGDGHVEIRYLQHGKPHLVKAKSVVMATGGWVARRTVADMGQPIRNAYQQFRHAPVLVVNVALNNWRFLERLGISAGRWYDGFGFFGSIRAPMSMGGQSAPFHPNKPMVMTFYVPYLYPGHDAVTQGTLGRNELLGKSYADYEREIRAHMNRVFADGGFDARRDIAGIVLNRWGHAYIAPQPGFYFGSKGDGLAAPMKEGEDRIFYGHSELGARMNYRNAIAEGGRAGQQAAERIV